MPSQVMVGSVFPTTATSAPKEISATSQPRTKVPTGIPGEYLIGIVFAASTLVVGGWFF